MSVFGYDEYRKYFHVYVNERIPLGEPHAYFILQSKCCDAKSSERAKEREECDAIYSIL